MQSLDKFDPATAGKYDPGQIIILYDNRTYKSPDSKLSIFQSYYLEGLTRLGWTSWTRQDLGPGSIRLIWYTHAGNQGSRDFPLYKAMAVKEMFDSLSQDGFRPMIIGWSAENPFPMIGGTEPPPPPKKVEPKRATTWSGNVSGHAKDSTPHERVMAIIDEEERREAQTRAEDVEGEEKALLGGAV